MLIMIAASCKKLFCQGLDLHNNNKEYSNDDDDDNYDNNYDDNNDDGYDDDYDKYDDNNDDNYDDNYDDNNDDIEENNHDNDDNNVGHCSHYGRQGLHLCRVQEGERQLPRKSTFIFTPAHFKGKVHKRNKSSVKEKVNLDIS